jgi:hypothetical protein
MKLSKRARNNLSTPFIWLPAFSFVIIHVMIFVYQAIAFRLYGLERKQLRSYVSFDRSKLKYLKLIDKINCAYCTYGNGVLNWAGDIAKATEYYWCGIKHHDQPTNPAFAYQDKFAAYGSEEDYRKVLITSGRDEAK